MHRWPVVFLLLSCSIFARVDIQEKQNRVNFLEGIAHVAPSLSIEAYQRELEYEKQDLPFEERARSEANLLAEAIKKQVLQAYEDALKLHNNDAAEAEIAVKSAIMKDLKLAAPGFREELEELSLEALRESQYGGINSVGNLKSIEKLLLPQVKARAKYLNEEMRERDVVSAYCPGGCPENAAFVPTANASRDSEKLEYKDKSELVSTLVSDRESTRWVSTANTNLYSSEITSTASSISLQVRIDFLGVSVEAGPIITFKREFSSNASIIAEGLSPILLKDGHFDFNKRDRNGKLIKTNGKVERRYVAFYCSNDLRFSSDYTGQGGFRVLGPGGRVSYSKTYSNSVSLTSRRILVPEYVGGKTVTIQTLAELCHYDLLKAKVNDRMTVEDSLDILMKNMIDGLRFSHPKTKCVTDDHCADWFTTDVLAVIRPHTFPRCVEEAREKYRSCVVRSLKNQACPVYDKAGKRVSNGFFEYKCDQGLKCVQTKEAGWFRNWEIYQYAEGRCLPIDPQTYESPQLRYTEIEIID